MAERNALMPGRGVARESNALVPDTLADGSPNPDATAGWQQAYDWRQAQRAQSVAEGYLDPVTGLPTAKGLQGAGNEYWNALLMGTTAPGGKIGGMAPFEHMLDQIRRDPKAKWGLRVVPEPVEGGPGTILPPSRVWDDGGPTEALLEGTSTIGINGATSKHLEAALKQAGVLPYGASPQSGYYPGSHVLLVKGKTAKPGYDDLERIIPNAELVSKYRKADDNRSELLPMASDADVPHGENGPPGG